MKNLIYRFVSQDYRQFNLHMTEKKGGIAMSNEQLQNCIEECLKCMVICNQCYKACLSEGHAGHMSRCIQLDRDCADICQLAASMMARGSEYAKQICELCASICEKCGNECKKHDMEHCQKCAEACFKCAEICRQLSA